MPIKINELTIQVKIAGKEESLPDHHLGENAASVRAKVDENALLAREVVDLLEERQSR